MKTFEAIQDGANYLGEEMDITSIAARFYSALYRFAVSLTRSETDAADLVQETFLALTRRSHQIRDFSQIKSWLFTTLRREFLRTIRRRKIYCEVEFLPDVHNLPASDLEPWRSLDARIVLDALLQVDEPYQATLRRFYLCEFSYKEIAEALKIPIGTVMSRLSRGKEQLKSILSNGIKVTGRKANRAVTSTSGSVGLPTSSNADSVTDNDRPVKKGGKVTAAASESEDSSGARPGYAYLADLGPGVHVIQVKGGER